MSARDTARCLADEIGDLRAGIGLLSVLRGAALREGRKQILPAIAALEAAARNDLRHAERIAWLPAPARSHFAPTAADGAQTRLIGDSVETLAMTQLSDAPPQQ